LTKQEQRQYKCPGVFKRSSHKAGDLTKRSFCQGRKQLLPGAPFKKFRFTWIPELPDYL